MAAPTGVVTEIFPEAPPATTAVILVADTTVNEIAAVPPKLTAVAPVKFVPVIVTVILLPALVGVNEITVGGPMNMNPGFVAVPPGVVTATLPEAPAATTAVTLVGETTVKDVAAVPPKFTAVAPVKFVPVIVTVVPLTALAGKKEVTVGAGIKIKPGLVAVPPGVVTETFPDAPAPTTAVILVADTTINEVAAVPPKLTAVVPMKFVPVMVTVVPLGPVVGVKLVIVGGRATVKLELLVIELHPNATLMVPVVAPAGTEVVILVAVLAITVAVVPLNVTMLLAGVVLKFVPVMLTVVPGVPNVGENEVMVGGDAKLGGVYCQISLLATLLS